MFSGAPVSCFSLYSSNNSDSVAFWNAAFGEIKACSLKATPFFKKIVYGSFEFVSPLRKKLFSRAPMKYFSLYGWNNWDSVVFGNAAFGEIKDHSLGTTSLKNKFAVEVLSCVCLTYKGIFKRTSEVLFSLWLKWVILCRFGNANLAEIKDHSLSTIIFLKTF